MNAKKAKLIRKLAKTLPETEVKQAFTSVTRSSPNGGPMTFPVPRPASHPTYGRRFTIQNLKAAYNKGVVEI